MTSAAISIAGQWWGIIESRFEEIRAVYRRLGGQLEAKDLQPRGQQERPFETAGSVAIIPVRGPLTKADDMFRRCFGGTSYMRLHEAVRAAAGDDSVESILLLVDSPGGQVRGCADVVDAIWRAREQKPVWAFIQDTGASCAYWLASQAQRIVANRTAEIGAIGVYLVVEDWSKAAEEMGIKVHVVRSGKFKGAGTTGTEVTPEQLADWQRVVDDLAAQMHADIARGRQVSDARVTSLADGRLHIGRRAIPMDLIDAVDSLESTVRQLQSGG